MAVTQIDGAKQIKSASISLDRLVEAVVQADGGQAFTGDQSMGGHLLTNVGTPSAGTDAANKNYVDGAIAGLSWKDPVRAATTANITLSGAQTIDGVSVIAGDRVLVKAQSAGADNGIYVAASGAWARATDADSATEVEGMAVMVMEGTANQDTQWVLTTNAPITLGTTALTITQFGGSTAYTGGAGLTLTGTTFDVVAADTSLTVNANDLQVNVNSTGGLEVSSGLRVKLDGGTLARGASGLKLDTSIFITRETPSGSVNGSNVTFTLANTPVAGS